MRLVYILMLIVFAVCPSILHSFQDYSSISIDDIDLSKFSIIKSNKFEIKSPKIYLDNSTFAYFNKMNDRDKKTFIKIAVLGLFTPKPEIKKNTFIIYKKDGSFKLETLVHIPIQFKKSLQIFRNFIIYKDWILKDINTRRGGNKGKYFVDILDLPYSTSKKQFSAKVELHIVFSGKYFLDLNVIDNLMNDNVPNLVLEGAKPTKLVKEIKGEFRSYIIPDAPFFVVYFSGFAKVHWAIYNFLPITVVETQIGERIETLLENIQYKVYI